MTHEIATSNNQMSFEQLKESATLMAKSKLFPSWDSPEKMMSLMLLCRAEGSDPITAVNRYDNIKGRISKKPIAMLADFIGDGGQHKYIESNEKTCKMWFKSPNGIEHEEEYLWADVVKANNQNKDNYKKYPKQMLRARCISNALRAIYPKSTSMTYIADEVEEIQTPVVKVVEPKESTPIIEVKATEVVETPQAETCTWEEKLAEIIEKYGEDNLVAYFKSIGFIKRTLGELQNGHKERVMSGTGAFESCVEKFIAKKEGE